jgi:hypothetical protein
MLLVKLVDDRLRLVPRHVNFKSWCSWFSGHMQYCVRVLYKRRLKIFLGCGLIKPPLRQLYA